MGSVKAYGAVGDGKSDDTRAIRHAIDQAGDGLIEFPRGDYRITETIDVPLDSRGRLSLDGMGGAGRVVMAGKGPAFRFRGTHGGTADPDSVKPEVWARQRMPRIRDLEVIGEHPDADGLEFSGIMQPSLSGVLIRNVRHAVHLVGRNRNVLIEGCHIYDCRGVGIFFDRVNLHQTIVSHSHISYCKGGGIKVVGSEIRNLQITGNDIEYNFDRAAPASADIWIDVSEGSVREGTIVSNTIQALVSPGGANIRMEGSADINKVSMFTITGNHISNQEVNIHLKNCRGVVLTGNSLALSTVRNLLIDGSRYIVVGPHSLDHNPDYGKEVIDGILLRNSTGCVLTGLLCEDARGGAEGRGAAIEVNRCNATQITGCQVHDPRFRGIHLSGCKNTVISGCSILAPANRPRMVSAIEVELDCSATLIHGNIVPSLDLIRAPNAQMEGNLRADFY